MAILNLKNIPDDVRDEFKILCLRNKTNMRAALVEYMKKAIERKRLERNNKDS